MQSKRPPEVWRYGLSDDIIHIMLQTMGDDEDVVLAGSQLHQHLLDCGYTEAGHLETAQPSGGRIQGHTEERDKR